MKALAKTACGPGHVALVDRDVGRPAAGEALLDVVGAGVCGTDLHILADEYRNEPPVTMGHEVSAVVAEVGRDVDESWLGARVVCETYFSTCAECAACRDGRRNLCARRRSIGSFEDGGFAARLVLPAVNLHRIPDWLDGHAAALSEPLACVCNCLCDPSVVSPGDAVLVTGPGAMGLLAGQVARAAGGEVLVTGTDRDAARLAAASALGLRTALAEDEDTIRGWAADVVLECSGTGPGIATCLRAARPGARYVQLGLTGAAVAVPFDEICYRELVVTSGFASTPRSWRRALGLIEAKRVQLEPLVSEVAPLDDWERVFAGTRAARGIKFILDPRL